MRDPLTEILQQVHCDLTKLTATVTDRRITAGSLGELRRGLVSALYDVLHAGRPESTVRHRRLRHRTWEAEFARGLPEPDFPIRTTVHAVDPDGGRVLVERDGVRTWTAHAGTMPPVGTVAEVRVGAARPALSPGFFLADSRYGVPRTGPILRMYVHLEAAESAVKVWSRMLSALHERKLPYRAKTCSMPQLFPRRDALVVYLDSAGAAGDLAAAVAGLSGIGRGTSAFGQRLADGIALAWEPEDSRPGMVGLSFGEHRSAALAAGLIDAAISGRDVHAAVVAAWRAANIDPCAPWRNGNSPAVG